MSVDFRVADATKLDGLDGRFDTVVDCAFYHVFGDDRALQKAYLQALHRVTKPGAWLFMFEFGAHNVNGLSMPQAIPEENFRQLLPVAGGDITYLGPTTYQGNIGVETFETFEMMAKLNPELADQMRPMLHKLKVIEPLLVNGRVHPPFWEVHATRATLGRRHSHQVKQQALQIFDGGDQFSYLTMIGSHSLVSGA